MKHIKAVEFFFIVTSGRVHSFRKVFLGAVLRVQTNDKYVLWLIFSVSCSCFSCFFHSFHFYVQFQLRLFPHNMLSVSSLHFFSLTLYFLSMNSRYSFFLFFPLIYSLLSCFPSFPSYLFYSFSPSPCLPLSLSFHLR